MRSMPPSLCCETTRFSYRAVQYIRWRDSQVVLTTLDIRMRITTMILDSVLIEDCFDTLIECYNAEQSRKEIMWIQSLLTMKTETDEYLP